MATTAPRSPIDAVAALGDPVRRRLHAAVRGAPEGMTREEAAAATGVSRKLAAFHLDKLVAVGLLEVGSRRRPARGVGRAPKVYEAADRTIAVSVPARAHDELAAVLVDAVEESGDEVVKACLRSAKQRGRSRGLQERRERTDDAPDSLAAVERCLVDEGYEPYRGDVGEIRLRNCPFHPLAQRSTDLVCGINLNYLRGVIEGMQVEDVQARLAWRPGECCVEVTTR